MTVNTLANVMNQAESYAQKGDSAAAIECYRHWLDNPQNEQHFRHVALFNMGSLLRPMGEADLAIVAYQEALRLKPDFYQAAINLGLAYESKGDQANALLVWNGALQPVEAQTLLLNHCGRLNENLKNYEEAEQQLKRSLMVNPEQPDALQHYLHIRQKKCQWPILEPVAGLTADVLQKYCGPLGVLALSDDPALQLQVMSDWVERKLPQGLPRLAPEEGYQHQKLRIGYFSCDFRWHAVSILTAELFELHDRDQFEIYAIDYSHDDGGAMRHRVLSAMDHHLPIHALSDEDAAKLIRQHEIDVLVDLTGLTAGSRLGVLAHKPAPVQISYLGYIGTSGMPEIDYILVDRFVFPDELKPYFTEKPLYLPDVYQCNDSQKQIGPTPSRASCHLPDEAFVYCSFNGSYKITPEVFTVWMRILSRVPNSVLWLIADNDSAKTNLMREAQKRGVDPARLIFAEKVPPTEYLARYRVADLLLDTSPYNAGTTASDALWAGLPVLTCPGKTFASRMAGSLVKAAGLSKLIMPHWQAYEDEAVRLAAHTDELLAYKQQLQEVSHSTLFDGPRFTRNLEQLYTQVIARLSGDQQASASSSDLDGVINVSIAVKDEGLNTPLVSILIPTHNRPDYVEIALKSALQQTYSPLEIIISDNGDNEETRERLLPYLKAHSNIKYYRKQGMTAEENWVKCAGISTGEYISFLMDDDILHPEKINRMMDCYIKHPDIGLVTSFRQLIDENGNYMPILPGTEPLVETDARINGRDLIGHILSKGSNVIGEPTTVLLRRADVVRFATFAGKNYKVLSDVATWMSILFESDCIYLVDTLSYFRLHSGQDQRVVSVKIRCQLEWLQLYIDAFERDNLLFGSVENFRQALGSKLVTCIWFVIESRSEIKRGEFNIEAIQKLFRQAFNLLMKY